MAETTSPIARTLIVFMTTSAVSVRCDSLINESTSQYGVPLSKMFHERNDIVKKCLPGEFLWDRAVLCRVRSPSGDEFVADAVDREDMLWICRVGFDLLAQLQNEVVHRARAEGLIIAPHVGKEFFTSDSLVAVVPEVLQDINFFWC